MDFDTWLKAVLALVAILNPVGNMPIFDELTEGIDGKSRFKIYNIAVATGFGTLLVLMLFGRFIMSRIFQIDIAEFRIAGGLLLTVLAVKYIVFPDKRRRIRDDHEVDSLFRLAVVPMAVPLMVGPGSIVTAILILDRDGYLISLAAIVTVFAFSWVVLQLSPWLNKAMGRIGRLVISRILWIFLAAIGVHFLVSGIKEAFGLG